MRAFGEAGGMTSGADMGTDVLVKAEVALRLERQLDAAQQITHIGSWEWDLATGAVIWSDELYRIYGLAPRSCAITLEEFLARVHPDDRERVQRQVTAAVQRGGPFGHSERIVRPDGSVRKLDTVGEVLVDAHGRPALLIGTCRDITDDPREFARRVQAGEQRALEMLATGAPLPDVLAELVRLVEEMAPEAIASILLMDDTGTRIQHGTAPSLPDAYNQAIHDCVIGSQAGSCGTAAFRRKPVFVTDIETDPLWEPYRDLARAHGLRACWSFPILATDGHVLGTAAVYYRQPRTAEPTVVELVSRVAHVAAIAIERRKIDELTLALSERTEAIREDERTGIARELHDQLGQALTALKLDMSWLARRLDRDVAVMDKLEGMKQVADGIIQSVERISVGLRPSILDLLGLEAAIKWQSHEFTTQTGITCELRTKLNDFQLDKDLATAVFRIFQEALTNITRHANASRITVDLRFEGSVVVLEVADDGVGLPPSRSRGRSLGLLGMGERARRLGGQCVVSPREPTGTFVSLRVPLSRD
ncbi:MAG TPA: GAF domain-containing protein [Vicinamibacterales bacterium]|nr:GAF domain-containing protein [Vicinamibacterales bacterium]